jgi:hypothetical protein
VWAAEGAVEEEGAMTGRLGRFNRRFEGVKGMDWMESVEVGADRQVEEAVKKGGK